MHKIGRETINSNISQKAMNRNRSRKKAKKKKYEKLPFTFRQIYMHVQKQVQQLIFMMQMRSLKNEDKTET